MGNIMKILTGILGIMAAIACLATIGVIGYTLTGAGGNTAQSAEVQASEKPALETPTVSAAPEEETAVPTATPETDGEASNVPVALDGHIHNYEETVDQKATCYQAGRLKYTCSICDDYYYVDIFSTGHVADDEWEITREATAERDGLRVKRCIYCDEIVVQETIPYSTSGQTQTAHVHDYEATIEREPTCVLAGLRKYTCSCGSFYTEQIPATGHVATDWTVAEEATSTKLGREQRTCTVCSVVLDSRPIPVTAASASPSSSASASAAASAAASASTSASASANASPTATSHTHSYTSYVLKEANCTEKGVRSFLCSCGSSYAETIDLDSNNHTYSSTVIAPTASTQGYTLYKCIRCNSTYMDNYVSALGTN